MSQYHSCYIHRPLPSGSDLLRSISKFITRDRFFLSKILYETYLEKVDVVLGFYDIDSTVLQLCLEKRIPIVITQHIYWGLCPKNDFWNNNFNCSCVLLPISKRDCKRCISKQHSPMAQLITHIIPSSIVNSMRLLRANFLAQCDSIVVPSNFMARLYESELGKGKTRIKVIHNGIDLEFYKPENDIVTLNKKRILYAGARTYAKGYHHFLKLASQVSKLRKDVEFAAFGWGNDVLNPYVKNLGYVKKASIPKIYSNSYALIFPALWDEPFAQVPLESMACGCPVIAYDSGGLSEMIKSGYNGVLVPRGDFKGLLQALLDFIDDDSTIQKMRGSCRTYAENNFSLIRMCNDYNKLLMEFEAETQ